MVRSTHNKPKLYDWGDVCDNIKETPSFSRGLPESDDIDNEDVAYVREEKWYMLKKTP